MSDSVNITAPVTLLCIHSIVFYYSMLLIVQNIHR